MTGGGPGVAAVFDCPVCGAVSHHPQDLADGYCGACRWWTGVPELLAGREDLLQVQARWRVCLTCGEPFTAGDAPPLLTAVIGDGGPVRRRQHRECQALQVIGHQFGVCSCHGFDTSSRYAAQVLSARIRTATLDGRGWVSGDATAPVWRLGDVAAGAPLDRPVYVLDDVVVWGQYTAPAGAHAGHRVLLRKVRALSGAGGGIRRAVVQCVPCRVRWFVHRARRPRCGSVPVAAAR